MPFPKLSGNGNTAADFPLRWWITGCWRAGTLRRQKDVAEQERLRADTERANAERAAEMAESQAITWWNLL